MRTIFVFLAGFALLCATPLHSAPPDAKAPKSTAEDVTPKTREQRLDELFGQLKRERNEKAAERIAGRIWKEWNNSGSAATDLMMQVHKEGKAVVTSGSRDKMEHDVRRLHAAGLWATLQRSE